jgi:(5-formylfuran-3-yl)methyl phosphate synthase
MKILVSVVSPTEAEAVLDGGADILDVKNVAEGSLGASFPWLIRRVAEMCRERPITLSATLGDLPYKPGTAALAANGALHAGARYIKAGLHGTSDHGQALEVMSAVVRTCREAGPSVIAVAAGYADYRRFQGLDPLTIIRVARASGADVVMLDTAIKDGLGLFDALSQDELAAFVSAGHAAGLEVALAGSVKAKDLGVLRRLGSDVAGVRGAVCRGEDRGSSIDAGLVRALVAHARQPAPA